MHSLPEWPVINSEVYMHTVIPNLVRLGSSRSARNPSGAIGA
jgi:hypothetical protein